MFRSTSIILDRDEMFRVFKSHFEKKFPNEMVCNLEFKIDDDSVDGVTINLGYVKLDEQTGEAVLK